MCSLTIWQRCLLGKVELLSDGSQGILLVHPPGEFGTFDGNSPLRGLFPEDAHRTAAWYLLLLDALPKRRLLQRRKQKRGALVTTLPWCK